MVQASPPSATALLAWMREQRHETELCHLGKQTGNIGRAIARWPLVGSRTLDKTITAKAAQGEEERSRAGRIHRASSSTCSRCDACAAFKRMLEHRAARCRHPGRPLSPGRSAGTDGRTGPRQRASSGAFVRALARRERTHYDWMAGYRPDLVIRLNVDFATALARKPDHRPSSLRDQGGRRSPANVQRRADRRHRCDAAAADHVLDAGPPGDRSYPGARPGAAGRSVRRWFADGVFPCRRSATPAIWARPSWSAQDCSACSRSPARDAALTPAVFGILMIVHTYATGAGAICVKFQTWQFIIRYGGPRCTAATSRSPRDTIRFAFGLDHRQRTAWDDRSDGGACRCWQTGSGPARPARFVAGTDPVLHAGADDVGSNRPPGCCGCSTGST